MRYSLSEYILYFNLKLIAIIFQALPLELALFIGRILGIFIYSFNFKRKRIAYRNLRIALAGEYPPPQLKAILKKNYENFGMNIAETLRLSKVNQAYINRYIKIRGKENLDNALKNQNGTIILGSHFGSWEICFAVAGILGYPFCIFAEEQIKNPLLDRFLQQVRQKHGTSVLKVDEQLRQVIRALQEKKFVGIVIDHGIRRGMLVNFFGRKAQASATAIRISLKFDVPILIGYIRRVKGAEHELVILPPFAMRQTGNFKEDIITNLETANRIVEDYIAKQPEQYLWSYKRFKYSSQRNILLLHDGKAGHLRQIQAILGIISEEAKKRQLEIKTKEVKVEFKSKRSSILQTLSVMLADRSRCPGCLRCFKQFLKPPVFEELQSYFADIVISCGSSAAAVNFVIANENQAKSVILMRPGSLSTKKFNLVIMPRHDNPPKRDNIIQTSGALNLINERYLETQESRLKSQGVNVDRKMVLGLFLGGDTKRFRLKVDLLKVIIPQIKVFLEKHDAQILITTSRRTSSQIERLVKQEFSNYRRCKLLVIANEKNIPEAVGGILGLSKIVIVSPESISMISEAASSGKYVIIFGPQTNIGRRLHRFLQHLVQEKYVYLTDNSSISKVLEEIVTLRPEIVKLQDGLRIKEALSKLL
ncbi:MAG: mitochondrial fission ELM1 family protein [Candidatus Omnitrophica bacterium]|nr:mitochondrial fission ELM1 family protein [Candidatus Omnitrophota bacterium]